MATWANEEIREESSPSSKQDELQQSSMQLTDLIALYLL